MKDIRDQTGITQQQLANYLGLSRSLLSRYEMGIRSAPSPAIEKLSVIRQILQEKPSYLRSAKAVTQLNTIRDKELNRLKDMIEKAITKVARLSAGLKAARQKYRNAFNTLHLCEKLQQFCPPGPEGDTERKCVELIEATALIQIKENNLAMQAELEVKLCMYEKMVELRLHPAWISRRQN